MLPPILFCLFLFLTLISCTRSRQDERNGCAILAEVIQTIKKYKLESNQETSELVFRKVVELANYGTEAESVYESFKDIADGMGSRLRCFYPDCKVFYCAAGRIKARGEKHVKGKRLKSVWDHVKVGELFLIDTYDQHKLEFRSPMEGIIIKMVMDDSVQNGIYIAQGDFQTPMISAERIGLLAEILDEAPSDNLIPTGVPLTSHVYAGNASKIYNQIHGMVTAYFNVMLHAYRHFLRPTSGKVPNHVWLFYLGHSWDLFIPKTNNLRNYGVLKSSGIKNLLYRPGQLVPENEIFAIMNDKKLIRSHKKPCILLDQHLEREVDILTWRYVPLDPTTELSPKRQAQIDNLIQAYNSGKFENICEHTNISTLFLEDARKTLEKHMTKPTPLLDSGLDYHPAVDIRQIPGLDRYIRKKAFESANKFESKNAIEKVFKSELSSWWTTFLPGSRVYFMEQLSQDGLLKCTFTEPFDSTLPSVPIGMRHKKLPYLLKRAYFFSSVEDANNTLRDVPYFVEFPNTPIPFDPKLTKRLLDLN